MKVQPLYYIFIIFSITFPNVFHTALGECTLEIYGGVVDDIPEIVQLVVDESKKLVHEFGDVNPRPYSIYITSNMNDFYNKSKGPTPEWGIAVAKLNPDRIILKAPGIANISFARMKEVIKHELNHIYLFRIPHHHSMPSWFKEGMAMRSSNEFSLLHKIEISKAIWQKQIIPLKQLQNISSLDRGKVKLAYGESAAAVEALEFFYGENILNNILNAMRSGSDFQQAMRLSSNDEFLNFTINFEIFLENNFNWVFLLRATKFVYVILPLILIIGFIYHRHRGKKIMKQWEIEEQLEKLEWPDDVPN